MTFCNSCDKKTREFMIDNWIWLICPNHGPIAKRIFPRTMDNKQCKSCTFFVNNGDKCKINNQYCEKLGIKLTPKIKLR